MKKLLLYFFTLLLCPTLFASTETESNNSGFFEETFNSIYNVFQEWTPSWNLFDESNNSSEASNSMEKQIHLQIGNLSLLDISLVLHDDISRESILQKLEEDLNIFIAVDDPTLFNKYFLSYIYNYFKVMFPDVSTDGRQISVRTPYYLYARNRETFPMVEVNNQNIYFSKNAGNKLITNRFRDIIQSVEIAAMDKIQLTFEYNNKLYFQMNEALLSSEDIKSFITAHTGVSFKLELPDPNYFFYYGETQDFTRDELLMMLEQFLILPPHIRDNLSLNKVIRLNYYDSKKAGIYHHATQTIFLFNGAFRSQEGSEGVFLHELGHALWGFGIWNGLPDEAKEAYESLSWEGFLLPETIGNDFITNYSKTNVSEDFAEHFSEYIYNPQALQNKVPKKYEWFKRHIFVNTEYFRDASMDHLKTFVHSDLQDISSPYFTNPPNESIQAVIKKTVEGKPMVQVEINNLFDDISGIEEICMSFSLFHFFSNDSKDSIRICRDSFNDNFEAPSDHSPCYNQTLPSTAGSDCNLFNSNKPGWYLLTKSITTDYYYPGIYQARYVGITDISGNKKYIHKKLLEDISIDLPGTKEKEEEEEEEEELLSHTEKQAIKADIDLLESRTLNGDTLVYVLIPNILPSSTNNISIELQGVNTERKLTYHISLRHLNKMQKQFEEMSEAQAYKYPDRISLPIVVPKELRGETYQVSNIFAHGNKKKSKVQLSHTTFDHTSNQADLTLPQAVVEDIKLTVLKGENKQGGDTSIHIEIPFEGLEHDIPKHYRNTIVMDMPQGGTCYARVITASKTLVTAQCDLKPHHQQGEYILSYVSHIELHDMFSRHITGWRMTGDEYVYEERLSERNIRKTITIETPPPAEEPLL